MTYSKLALEKSSPGHMTPRPNISFKPTPLRGAA